jgi:hypothetical protein
MTEDPGVYGRGEETVDFFGTATKALSPVDQAKAVLERFGPEVKAVRHDAEALVVADDGTNKVALNIIGGAKELTKALKKKLSDLIEEPEGYVKKLKAFVKVFTDDLDAADKACRKKVADYQYQLELERRKLAEEARKQTEALQAKMDADAKAAGVEAPQIPTMVVPTKASPVRTSAGVSGSIRLVWAFEVLDLAKVPDEYTERVINEKAVKDAITNGKREIQGLRIFEKPSSVIRTS